VKQRVLVIGNIYGRKDWKQIIEKETGRGNTLCLFLGNYLASVDISSGEMLRNLREIIEFAYADPFSCKLLLGRHDMQYFPSRHGNAYYATTMHRRLLDKEAKELFRKWEGFFEPCFQLDSTLFTNGPITNSWMRTFKTSRKYKKYERDYAGKPLGFILQDQFEKQNIAFVYNDRQNSSPLLSCANDCRTRDDCFRMYSIEQIYSSSDDKSYNHISFSGSDLKTVPIVVSGVEENTPYIILEV